MAEDFSDIYCDEKPDILFQGDIITDIPSRKKLNEEDISGFMLVNNTCDMYQSKDYLDSFLLIPVRSMEFYVLERKKNKAAKDKTKNIIFDITRYKTLSKFFLPPTQRFGSKKPHYADFSIMSPIPINKKKMLLSNRKASLKIPVREKLGHMLGVFFSRVSIPEEHETKHSYLKGWKDEYVDGHYKS